MMFGQLSHRESLRDLIVAMEAHSGKFYHPEIGKPVTRSNPGKAKEQRDYRIFEEFASFMPEQVRKKRQADIFKLGGSDMLSIQPLSTSAFLYSSGQSFARKG
jgi:hypothetical protein